MEENREGINQGGPRTTSARKGSLQVAFVWNEHSAGHRCLEMHTLQLLPGLKPPDNDARRVHYPSPTPSHQPPPCSFKLMKGGTVQQYSKIWAACTQAQSVHTIQHQRGSLLVDQENKRREVTRTGEAEALVPLQVTRGPRTVCNASPTSLPPLPHCSSFPLRCSH